MQTHEDPEAIARMGFMLDLRRRGIGDSQILRAMDEIPRARFVDPEYQDLSYQDIALPIPCGQTLSQPSIVAMMTEMLAARPDQRVLEIGTGSGYQTAIISRLCRFVITLDRWKTLTETARRRLSDVGIGNATTLHADGFAGVPERAPFDRILITASCEEVPEPLFEQLKDGGILVAPVGSAQGPQKLVRFRKTPEGLHRDSWAAVLFSPLQPGLAREL